MRHVLWVLGMAMAVRSASGLEQIVLIDTDVYEMKDNGHPESHHHFSFQNRPPNNDFRPYKPMTEGTWHIRLSILERPSTERVRIQPFLDDGKAWGHRGLGVRPLTDYPVVFEFVNTGYGEWPNATPIDWSNPPSGVDVFLQTADPTATVNKCGFDGQCWNVMYTDTEVWPYRIRMTVTLVPPGGTYDDTGHPGSVVSTVVTETKQDAVPDVLTINQNYPNPFNLATTIRFDLPRSEEVELAVYNLTGQKIATLVHGRREGGTYTLRWDGRDDDGRELASGVYLYRLVAGERVETRRMLLLK